MDSQTAVKIFIPVTVGLIMFALGLGLTVKDFMRVFEQPKAAAIGLLSQLFLLPLGGFICAWSFGLGPEMAVGMIILSACPGGAHSNLYSYLAKGDTALSVTLTAISGVITIFTLPLVVYLATKVFATESDAIELPILDTMFQILVVTGIPMGVGMLFRAKASAFATKIEPWVKGLAVFILLFIITAAVAMQFEQVKDFAKMVGWAVVTLNLSTMVLGWGASKIGGLDLRQTLTVIIEVGLQNSALAVNVAMNLLGSTVIAVPAIVYSLLVYFTGGVVVLYGRRTIREI